MCRRIALLRLRPTHGTALYDSAECKLSRLAGRKMGPTMQWILLGLVALAIVFSILSIVLIDNTIRLAMYSNRFLIKTMQMVGATAGFYIEANERQGDWQWRTCCFYLDFVDLRDHYSF